VHYATFWFHRRKKCAHDGSGDVCQCCHWSVGPPTLFSSTPIVAVYPSTSVDYWERKKEEETVMVLLLCLCFRQLRLLGGLWGCCGELRGVLFHVQHAVCVEWVWMCEMTVGGGRGVTRRGCMSVHASVWLCVCKQERRESERLWLSWAVFDTLDYLGWSLSIYLSFACSALLSCSLSLSFSLKNSLSSFVSLSFFVFLFLSEFIVCLLIGWFLLCHLVLFSLSCVFSLLSKPKRWLWQH
jgi:hypothetical protein